MGRMILRLTNLRSSLKPPKGNIGVKFRFNSENLGRHKFLPLGGFAIPDILREAPRALRWLSVLTIVATLSPSNGLSRAPT